MNLFPTFSGGLCIALAACLSTASLAQDSVDSSSLKWKLAAGQTFQVTASATTDIETVADTRTTSYRNRTTTEYSWKVIEVDSSGTATIEQTLNRIKLDFGDPARPDQAIVVDTNADRVPANRVSKEQLEKVVPMIGVTLQFKLTPRGATKNLVWPEEIDNKEQFMFGLADDGGGDTGIPSLFKLPLAPEKPVSRWETQAPLGRKGNSWRTNIYEIVPAESTADRVLVKISTSQDQLKLEPTELEIGQTAKLLDYSGVGKIVFNTADGFMSESTMSQTVKTSVEYREKTIAVDTQTTSKITIEPAS